AHPDRPGRTGRGVLPPGGGLPPDRTPVGRAPGRGAVASGRGGGDGGQTPACARLCQLRALLRRGLRRLVVLRRAVHQLLPGAEKARPGGGQGGPSAVAAGRPGAVRPTGPAALAGGRAHGAVLGRRRLHHSRGCEAAAAGGAYGGDGAPARADRGRVAREGRGPVVVLG